MVSPCNLFTNLSLVLIEHLKISSVFPTMLVVKNLPANKRDVRDAGSIAGWGGSPGGGQGNPLQYSCLENPTDRGACQGTVHRVRRDSRGLARTVS